MQRAASLLALLLALPLAAHAFDGRREGFLFGFSFGSGYLSIEQEWLIAGQPSQRKDISSILGIALQFGYGYTDHLILGSVLNWGSSAAYRATKLRGKVIKRDNASFEIDGFSATYFFKKRAPSPFVEALIGIARWNDGGDNVLDGLGLAGSIGYEFDKNWIVKGTLGRGTPSAETTFRGNQVVKADVTGLVIAFNAGYLWY